MKSNDLFKAVSCYDLIFSGRVSLACIICSIYFSGSHSHTGLFSPFIKSQGGSERIVKQQTYIEGRRSRFSFELSGTPKVKINNDCIRDKEVVLSKTAQECEGGGLWLNRLLFHLPSRCVSSLQSDCAACLKFMNSLNDW